MFWALSKYNLASNIWLQKAAYSIIRDLIKRRAVYLKFLTPNKFTIFIASIWNFLHLYYDCISLQTRQLDCRERDVIKGDPTSKFVSAPIAFRGSIVSKSPKNRAENSQQVLTFSFITILSGTNHIKLFLLVINTRIPFFVLAISW